MSGYVLVLLGCVVCAVGGGLVGYVLGKPAAGEEAALAQFEKSVVLYSDSYPRSSAVAGVETPPELRASVPLDGPGEFWAIDWLRSRTFFRDANGMAVMGHDLLISAVKQIDRMHAELLACRNPVIARAKEAADRGDHAEAARLLWDTPK